MIQLYFALNIQTNIETFRTVNLDTFEKSYRLDVERQTIRDILVMYKKKERRRGKKEEEGERKKKEGKLLYS